jgi:hypothetical protein
MADAVAITTNILPIQRRMSHSFVRATRIRTHDRNLGKAETRDSLASDRFKLRHCDRAMALAFEPASAHSARMPSFHVMLPYLLTAAVAFYAVYHIAF